MIDLQPYKGVEDLPPPPNAQELILLGEELLDLFFPEWRDHIVLEDLDLTDGYCCVLGQVASHLSARMSIPPPAPGVIPLDANPYLLGAYTLWRFALDLPEDVGSEGLRALINAEKAEIGRERLGDPDGALDELAYDHATSFVIQAGFCPAFFVSPDLPSPDHPYVVGARDAWCDTINNNTDSLKG